MRATFLHPTIIKHDNFKARRGTLTFERGAVETPAFMPVGTYGTVKAMTPEEVEEIGAQIILGNTFHLAITPGTDVIKAHGDLHEKSSQYLHLNQTEFLLILLVP
jgi:queuine tRNA-ribosyltransferase